MKNNRLNLLTADQPYEVLLSECPEIQALQRGLKAEFTKIWPTRYLAICPPAYAGVRPLGDLGLGSPSDGELSQDLCRALVVFLPADYEANLTALASSNAIPRVQQDIGLESSGAYWSWTLPAPAGQLPRSVWVLHDEVRESLEENFMLLDKWMLPTVWVAGQKAVVTNWRPTAELLAQGRNASTKALQEPKRVDPEALKAAKAKALRYGERPWLFMRYELRNGHGRLAVNWAPVHAS